MPTLIRTLVGLSALGLTACGAETAVAPTEYERVAQMLAESLASDVGGGLHGALDDAWALAHGTLPTGFVVDRFGWVSGFHGAATYKYRLACADVANQPITCGATTDRATVVATWYAANPDSRFNRVALWNFADLQTGATSITGVDQLTSQATFGPDAYALTSVFDERYLFDNVARELYAADLTGDLSVSHDGDRFAIAALIELDRDTTSAAILLDDDLVLRATLSTTYHGD